MIKNLKIFFKKIDLIIYEIKSWIRRLDIVKYFKYGEVNELNIRKKETWNYIHEIIKGYVYMDKDLIWKVYFNG